MRELSPQLCFYDRHLSSILGDNRSPSPELLDVRFCFNCGSPDHIIASCPEPQNRPLITLSRQLFNFLHPEGQTRELARFHVVEAWKQQRLEWLKIFQPGKIVGSTLRRALDLQHGDSGQHCEWLHNMSLWGYPVGWVSDTDPMDLVRQRILGTLANVNSPEDFDHTLFIFSDEEDCEVIDLSASASFYIKDDDETSISNDTSSINFELEPSSSTPRRWATYPTTYFSSHQLTVYNGFSLPSIAASSCPGNTFTAERRALWEQIISGPCSAKDLIPPWRMPGTFSSPQSYNERQPPPPASIPPPLPPPPPAFLSPPPLPARSPQSLTPATCAEADDSISSDVDMDLSDDE